jgi:hypothetical protein
LQVNDWILPPVVGLSQIPSGPAMTLVELPATVASTTAAINEFRIDMMIS